MNGGPWGLIGALGTLVMNLPAAWDALKGGAVPPGLWVMLGAGLLWGLVAEVHSRLTK